MMAEFAPPSLGADYNPLVAAKYYELSSQLDLSAKQAEANSKLGRETANAGYQYGRGNLLRSEPQRIKANINSANSQGLAESGQLAKAQTNTQSEYGQKQLALSNQRSEAIKRANLSEGQARERREAGDLAGYKTAVAEQNQYNIEHPPIATTPSTPNGVAPSPTSNLPAGYTATTQKGGSVSISPPPPPVVIGGKAQPLSLGTIRKKAAAKAVG